MRNAEVFLKNKVENNQNTFGGEAVDRERVPVIDRFDGPRELDKLVPNNNTTGYVASGHHHLLVVKSHARKLPLICHMSFQTKKYEQLINI